MKTRHINPVIQGAALALLAATLFGLSTPLVQHWGAALGPFTTAALLYAGAALVAMATQKQPAQEARLQRSDLGRLLAMALLGAAVGPVALAWGLQRTGGASASLLLTLEAVFTAGLAWKLYGETLDRRVVAAMGLLLVGGGVLVLDQRHQGEAALLGLASVALATLAWGLDNTLSRGVADRDPGQVVAVKAVLGLTATAALAWGVSEPVPGWGDVLRLLLVGASGYGLSLRFYLLAQRTFGAARTGSVFAFAPFVGTLGAFAMGERTITCLLLLGGALMLVGVALHLAESHRHEHTHEALVHEHAHRHDDGHHDHTHDPMPQGAHSHRHVHIPVTHTHAHVPDLHHAHPH